MRSSNHVRFGTFDVLEKAAMNLVVQGYTKATRRDECGPKQYYLGPEHPERPNAIYSVLLWESA